MRTDAGKRLLPALFLATLMVAVALVAQAPRDVAARSPGGAAASEAPAERGPPSATTPPRVEDFSRDERSSPKEPLQDRVAIHGHVRDSGGTPVGGAQVYALPRGAYASADPTFAESEGRTDVSGAFSIVADPVSERIVMARKEGFRPASASVVTGVSGSRSSVDLVLDPGATIAGSAVDLAGAPIEGAEVRARGSAVPARRSSVRHSRRRGISSLHRCLPTARLCSSAPSTSGV